MLGVWFEGGAGPVGERPFEASLGDLAGSGWRVKAFWMKKERSGERECSSSAVDEVQWHNGKIMVFGAQ